jgi:ubiquinone biosynthesis protein COQ9
VVRSKKTEDDHIKVAKDLLLASILPNVEFDGWSSGAFEQAVIDSGVDISLVHQIAPRGAIDLAVAFHKKGDELMMLGYKQENFTELKYSEKVMQLIKLRIQASNTHKGAVRKGMSLFALPQNINEGGQLIWKTSDKIWNTLGDKSTDSNWYTKRTTLSAVYSATVLFWLCDDSDEAIDTWNFLNRRIQNVMEIEKAKAKIKKTSIGQSVFSFFDFLQKPSNEHKSGFPGYKG